ncbi:MAG: sigma-70 family RNA polymerase sigma factor [Candidatus Rokubacteria bacterium]|nr:sigma-70 family RNA polymerase sigma factor [Candidatus Rokubacteria bacterium]
MGADSDFERDALAHLDALYNFALYLTRSTAEADDLVQETYLRAFRFSHRFQPGTHLRAWLFQILRNTFFTFYRIRDREAAVAEDGVPDWDVPMFHDAPDEDGVATETHTDLERAMRRLPEDFRTVLLLAEVEGLPLEEVARVMSCPVGTVKSRIFRGEEAACAHCWATTTRNDRTVRRPFGRRARPAPGVGAAAARRTAAPGARHPCRHSRAYAAAAVARADAGGGRDRPGSHPVLRPGAPAARTGRSHGAAGARGGERAHARGHVGRAARRGCARDAAGAVARDGRFDDPHVHR